MNENKLLETFNDPHKVQKYCKRILLNYQSYNPGQYLYSRILNFKEPEKDLKSFIELCYATLWSWNMNARGAKLASFRIFKSNVFKYYPNIKQLQSVTLKDASETDFESLKKLFLNMSIVDRNKSRLVATSKFLHFCLPHFMMPIDRTYSIPFFNTSIQKEKEKQAAKFICIQKAAQNFTRKISLESFVDPIVNRSIPKLIDNLIIYQKRKQKDNL